jgi:HEPN domain-containing protein
MVKNKLLRSSKQQIKEKEIFMDNKRELSAEEIKEMIQENKNKKPLSDEAEEMLEISRTLAKLIG